jgi:hypothetical protein
MFLPHFSCKIAGDALISMMKKRPEKKLTVLCGHTHGGGQIEILPNLQVIAGGAQYGIPEIQRIFEIE